MIKKIKTFPSLNPRFKDYLIIGTEEPRVYFIPEKEFLDLVIRAGRRFRTLAPLAPYPLLIGCEWRTNGTIYKWFLKELKKIQVKYEDALEIRQ